MFLVHKINTYHEWIRKEEIYFIFSYVSFLIEFHVKRCEKEMHESDNGVIEGFAVLVMFFFLLSIALHVEITFHSGPSRRYVLIDKTLCAKQHLRTLGGLYQRATRYLLRYITYHFLIFIGNLAYLHCIV